MHYIYKSEFFQWHGQAASGHNPLNLDDTLNKWGREGWLLWQIAPVSIGFLLVFMKEKE